MRTYCFSQHTYFVASDEEIYSVRDREGREGRRIISYYQWIPFFFLLQALSNYLPKVLWQCLYENSGMIGNALYIPTRFIYKILQFCRNLFY